MGSELDPAFIQTSEHRPNPNVAEAGEIPLIDLSPLQTTPIPADGEEVPGALKGLVAQVGEACRVVGFFQVVNHGVPMDLLRTVQSAAKEFFALPPEEKRRVRRDEENFLGYYDTEVTKNVRDWKETFDFTGNEPMIVPATAEAGETRTQAVSNRWPERPPRMRDACMEYAKAVEELAYKLLELISMTLNLPARRMDGYFKDSISRIRVNHYPPCPSPELALGVGPHKDQGAITILAQDEVGGLDVRRKSDGEWVRVKPVPTSYVINIGDLIQVWSNDKYASTEHRASVNPTEERFSIPFFFYPSHYTTMKPIEELVGEDSPARYKEFSWGQFFKSRRNSNFQKLGVENLQIHHFRNAI